MEGFESLRGRERAVIIALSAFIFVALLSILSSAAELSLLGRIERGEVVGDAELEANDTRTGAVEIAWSVAWIVCAVFFIRWLRAAFRNTDVLSPGLRRHGHGWAIGSWFVPLLNFVRPKKIVNDTYRAGANSHKVSSLLHVWWGFWLATTVVWQFATRRSPDAGDIDAWQTTSTLFIVNDVVDASAAVLAIAVVRLITRLQHERAAAIASAPPPEAPPVPVGAPGASVPPPGWPANPERPAAPG